MGSPAYGKIFLGGTVTKKVWEMLCDEEPGLEDFLDEDGEPLCYENSEASYGQFDELEAACRKWGVPYTRYSEATPGDGAVMVYWHPGMTKPVEQCIDDVGIPCVDIRKAKAALKALQKGKTDLAVKFLEYLCQEPPEPPPFKIEG